MKAERFGSNKMFNNSRPFSLRSAGLVTVPTANKVTFSGTAIDSLLLD